MTLVKEHGVDSLGICWAWGK